MSSSLSHWKLNALRLLLWVVAISVPFLLMSGELKEQGF